MNLLNNSRRSFTCWMLAIVVAILMPQMAWAAPQADEQTLAKRREAISKMPESDRQELARKYDAYRKLSEPERNQLRSLHKDIEADPNVKRVMQEYVDWLKDLDVAQRDQLRQAKTPEQKRNLVVRFRQEQLKRNDEVWREMSPPPQEKKGLPMPVLSGENLKSVMTSIEQDAIKQQFISPATQESLSKAEGTQRYKLLMRAIADFCHPKDGSVRRYHLSTATREAIADTVQNHEIKQKLVTIDRMPELQQQNMQRMLYSLLRVSAFDEARAELFGNQAQSLRESLFQNLSPEDQVRFSQMPPEFRNQYLSRIHAEEIWRSFSEAGDLPMRPFMGDGPGRGPFPMRRQGDNRSPDHPPRQPNDQFRKPPNDGRRPNSE